ncbi:MAG: TatD family hydrolase [Desulfuromonadales bacterium]|nr:TatD family hydrolase [Desulfuromonadales bacterium]
MDPLNFIDTHVHLDRCQGDLAAARAAGTGRFVVPGVTASRWAELAALARQHRDVSLAFGLHPQAAAEWSPALEHRLTELLQRPQTIAVGEIGLDAEATTSTALQEEVFRVQLRLAINLRLPVLIHCRHRSGRIIEILTEEGAERVGGIMHAFSGSIESARQLIKLGFALGIGGVLTWPNARRVATVVEIVPDEALVLETDAPDLAPHPHRGAPNRPEYLPLIAARLAALRDWSLAQTARTTTANARRVLHLEH